jgi:hypothetical protein
VLVCLFVALSCEQEFAFFFAVVFKIQIFTSVAATAAVSAVLLPLEV